MAKPATPEQIAQRKLRDRELAERRAEKSRLRAQGLEVTVDKRTEEVLGARRLDVVQMMGEKGTLTTDQVEVYRGLERLLNEAGESSRSCLSALDRVSGGGDGTATLQRRQEAIKKLVQRQERLDAGSWAMLVELATGGGLLSRWHLVVQRRTGETNPHAQAGAVRQVIRALESAEYAIAKGRKTNDFIGGMLARAEEAA